MYDLYNRDAYQIAENTPRSRHYSTCRALGVGALITEVRPDRLCNCWVVRVAYTFTKED